ncbi:VirB4 family type IV secretion system protein [Fodinicola acaciae]|uniref:VirB4 family type IV secretion system protein n=1 Tax=Fodinicola acaciae TaxID=2681555 RepID=UPI001FE8A553|nr:DUF87 domain-containing protein [Fodinicola acaciae]
MLRDLLLHGRRLASNTIDDASKAGEEAGGRLAPDGITVAARHVRAGHGYAAVLAVTGYPAEVGAGWLEPLAAFPAHLDVTLHIDPIDAATAARQLKKQREKFEANRRYAADHGHLDDPEIEAAATDAADLAHRLARGQDRLFRLGLYLTVHATTVEQLEQDVAEVTALAESLLLRATPTTWRALAGWTSTLPVAVDHLRLTRTMDTSALASAMPFTSPDLPAPDPTRPTDLGHGVLYGTNLSSPGVVVWDRWRQDNANMVVLGRSGAGKSYLTKLDLLRHLYQDADATVIDPEDEYVDLAGMVGGITIALGQRGVHLNPFDLPAPTPDTDGLTEQVLFLHTLINTLLRQPLTAAESAVLDTAIMATYRAAGINSDPRTWRRPAPLMADLATALREQGGAVGDIGAELAERLAPYVTGSHSMLFAGPTTARAGGHLTVYSLRRLPPELHAAGTLLVLDAVWRTITDRQRGRRHLVYVDEAWTLLRDGHGAQFLYRLAKSIRKNNGALTVTTQDVDDVLQSDLGKAVLNNASTHVLLGQAPQALDAITAAFRLTAGERSFLATAQRGHALLIAGRHRVGVHALASPEEQAVIRTDPEFRNPDQPSVPPTIRRPR